MAEKEKPYKYRQEITQMMYVSGETGEPSVETTSIIEDIVRQQVIELVRLASRPRAIDSMLTAYSFESPQSWLRGAAQRLSTPMT
jgi:type II secretory pathway component PulM